MGKVQRFRLLGLPIDNVQFPDILERLSRWKNGKLQRTIFYLNVHVVNTFQADPSVFNIADIVYCDGFGVQLGLKILGCQIHGRITGADWIFPFCDFAAKKKIRIFILAASVDSLNAAVRRLKNDYKKLKICGFHNGYFSKNEEDSIIAEINRAEADVLFVGLGSPRQEQWVYQHRAAIHSRIVWTVGALFDFVSGHQKRAPDFFLTYNLEWLYRLIYQPARMWRRYLIGNTKFLFNIILQKTGIRKK